MANQSARELLSRLPIFMADGGEATYGKHGQTAADLLAAEQRILGEIAEDPSSWDPAKAYNAILESGVTIDDALEAGVKQSTIDAIFTSGAPLPVTAFSTPSTVQSSFETFDPYKGMTQAEIAANAQQYVAGLMADGVIDEAERREVQDIATERGVTFQDMLAAGVDPNILFNLPTPEEPVTPTCPDGYTYNEELGVCVQDRVTPTCPDGYTYNEEIGACMPVTTDEVDDETVTCEEGYTYDPVFKACIKDVKDISCPTGYRFDEATQSCVEIFPEVDTDTGSGADSATGVTVYQPIDFDPSVFDPGQPSLDTEFRESAPRTEVIEDVMGTPQLVGFDYVPAASLISATGSGFSWTPPTVTGRPRSLMSTDTLRRYTQGRAAQDLRQLVGGNEEAYRAFEPLLSQTGSYGGGLSRSQLYALMRQQASQQAQQEAANYAQFGTRFGARPAGTTGYAEIAGDLSSPTAGALADPMTVRPIDLRYDQFAKGGEVKKFKGTAREALSQFANGGEASTDYMNQFMDLSTGSSLRAKDEKAYYDLVNKERQELERKYGGSELTGAYGNRRLLGTDPETGRNVYVADLVAQDVLDWGMARGQTPAQQRIEVQGPGGYFQTVGVPTADTYRQIEQHGFKSAARGNDIADTGRRVTEYLDEYSRGVQRDVNDVLQSARLNPELAQQVMGFVQSQRPAELTYMPTYELPQDVQLAEGVNRDLYNKMLLANLSGQQQQKAATRELLAALPEADLADLVNMYGATPGYLLTQGGRARQPEYTNIEQLQRAAYQRGAGAQAFNPFTGRMENLYQEKPYGSFKTFQYGPENVADPKISSRYQTYYTPTSELVSQYGMSPEQAFQTGFDVFGKRNLYNLAEGAGLSRDYATAFAERQPEYMEVNPYEERRIAPYTGDINEFIRRQLGGFYVSGSPVYSQLTRRYFDPETGSLGYYDLNDERFSQTPLMFAEGGSVSKTDVDPLQQQLLELDRQAMEQELRTRQAEPSAEDQATRTESRGMLDRLNQSFFENVTKPVIGSALDMTVGLGDLGQMGVKYLANKAGIETKPFIPVSQRLQESAGVAGYDPYSPAAVATQILPFARGQQAKQAATASAGMLQRLFPNLGRETAAYGGSELAAAGARELMPDSTAAELLASAVGGMGTDIGSTAITRRMADDIEPPDLPETESSRMLDEVEQATVPAPARLSRGENAIINERVGTSRNRRQEAKAEAQRVKSNYSPEEGWMPIEVSNVKYKNNKPKVEFKKIPYGFQNPPTGMDRDAWRQQLANGVVSEVEDVVRRAQQGDQAALDILAQANWYRGMRDQLRSEFGGIGDVFADVLGTTSAQTNVEQNFKNAVEILRRYSRGEYDNELAAYQRRIDQGLPVDGQTLTRLHKEGEFPLITKAGGELFNTNSPSSMGALLDMFRSVKTGSSPKTPNFTGNLIGLTNEATIDVWAARMLRRMSEQPRIPPAAEQGVSGSHLVGSSLYEPRVGGEFGFGQEVFRDAANRINSSGMIRSVSSELGDLGPDDLQAVAWFIEKERWTNNGWTTKAGEGGSLEYEMSLAGAPDQARVDELRRSINQGFKAPARRKTETDAEYEGRVAVARRTFDDNRDQMQAELSIMEAPLQRYQLGVSGERPNQPMSGYAQAELAAEFDDVVRNDDSVLTYNLANTYGSFMGDTERALNAEFVVRQNFNPEALRRRLIEQGKAYDQDAVFLSRVVSADTPNARPGVEIYFKESITPAQMARVTERLREKGVDGFTYVTDMRFDDRINRQTRSGDPETAALTGLRFQYVPEFDDAFDPARSSEIYAEQEDLFRDVVADTMADGNVSDARMTYYDTEIYFRDDYDEYLTRSAPEGNPEARGELATGADDPQSNRSGEGRPEPPEPVRDGGGQAPGAELSLVESITPEQREAWRNANKGDFRQTQTPELADAARDLDAGKISIEDYAQKVKELRPIELITEVPKISSFEEMAYALDKNKVEKGLIGLNKEIPDGTLVGSRLDIPAYNNYDTWVVSVHEGTGVSGKSMGYGKVAVLDDVKFNSNPDAALGVATGKKDKAPFARMNGKWRNMDVEEARSLAEQYLDDPEWTQVGMNPYRHSFFYDKNTGMPVDTAEQVIQIGPLVLAKKATTRPLRSPEHMLRGSTAENPKYFKHGGNVERMTNDNRKYI